MWCYIGNNGTPWDLIRCSLKWVWFLRVLNKSQVDSHGTFVNMCRIMPCIIERQLALPTLLCVSHVKTVRPSVIYVPFVEVWLILKPLPLHKKLKNKYSKLKNAIFSQAVNLRILKNNIKNFLLIYSLSHDNVSLSFRCHSVLLILSLHFLFFSISWFWKYK